MRWWVVSMVVVEVVVVAILLVVFVRDSDGWAVVVVGLWWCLG